MKYPQHPRCTPCPLLLLNTSSLSWMQATLLITSLLSLVSTPALSLGFALSTALTLPKPLEVDLPSLLPPMFAIICLLTSVKADTAVQVSNVLSHLQSGPHYCPGSQNPL